MNKQQIFRISIILTAIVFVISPIFVSAGPSAGIKPNSIFYFFDIASEKVGLFFTFDSEKKAQKALEYADERLAEAEESANDNKPKDVEKAMEGYKKEISFATEKSKELKDETKIEVLLNAVSESTAKHQEVLASVLEKVPEEAKQAILNAIEVSKKGQEEAQKQIAELKGEVEQLKKELADLKLENKNIRMINDSIQKKQECDDLLKKIPDKRGYDNWGNTSDIASLYNRAKVLLAQENSWDTDENKKLVKEVFDEAKPLYENYVNKCGETATPKVKAPTPQNPKCLALKEQINIQNNKSVEIKKALQKIKGRSNNSNVCEGKILEDQISCFTEYLKLTQEFAKKYEQQISDIDSVIKGLQGDYKKYDCK